MFSRFCHFYSMSDAQVLDMPVRRFWLMNSNIQRIQAEFDLRKMSVVASAQDGKAYEQYRKTLVIEIGDVTITNQKEGLDRAGLEMLRAMGGGL